MHAALKDWLLETQFYLILVLIILFCCGFSNVGGKGKGNSKCIHSAENIICKHF